MRRGLSDLRLCGGDHNSRAFSVRYHQPNQNRPRSSQNDRQRRPEVPPRREAHSRSRSQLGPSLANSTAFRRGAALSGKCSSQLSNGLGCVSPPKCQPRSSSTHTHTHTETIPEALVRGLIRLGGGLCYFSEELHAYL